jgi:hypothetical protein
MSQSDSRALARFRGALMAVNTADHPVRDPTRSFTLEELERFEAEFFRRIEAKDISADRVFRALSRLGGSLYPDARS